MNLPSRAWNGAPQLRHVTSRSETEGPSARTILYLALQFGQTNCAASLMAPPISPKTDERIIPHDGPVIYASRHDSRRVTRRWTESKRKPRACAGLEVSEGRNALEGNLGASTIAQAVRRFDDNGRDRPSPIAGPGKSTNLAPFHLSVTLMLQEHLLSLFHFAPAGQKRRTTMSKKAAEQRARKEVIA